MPELPEVETVRRGLEPWLEGARIDKVTLNRPNLRFPFPKGLAKALEGQTITSVGRRAKYLLLQLSNGQTLLSHLGMTGSWRFAEHGIDHALLVAKRHSLLAEMSGFLRLGHGYRLVSASCIL